MPNPSINGGGVLWSIQPLDSNIVYFVGGHNIILKTTNGGQNWIEIRNGPNGAGYGFAGIHFLNKDTGWICGSQRVLRTTNGGLTFDSSYVPYSSLQDIYFIDYNTGLICSEGYVLKTTNAGENWFNTNVPNPSLLFFRKLAVAENQYAWVMGNNGTVYRSTNFGDTWTLIDTIAIGGFIPIHFSSALTGWAGGSGNRLYKSTDGGFSWRREQTDSTTLAFIASIGFVNDSIGWYCGGVGKMYHTTTGGQTLVSISGNNSVVPNNFDLSQNFPNPFNPTTKIKFAIPRNSDVRLRVFDQLGREVQVLVDEGLSAGTYEYEFTGEGLSSGIYFYRLEVGSFVKVRRMLLLK